VTLLLDAAAKSGAIRSDFDPEDVLLAVAASTWAFVNDGDWKERALRMLRLVMDGLRYKPADYSVRHDPGCRLTAERRHILSKLQDMVAGVKSRPRSTIFPSSGPRIFHGSTRISVARSLGFDRGEGTPTFRTEWFRKAAPASFGLPTSNISPRKRTDNRSTKK